MVDKTLPKHTFILLIITPWFLLMLSLLALTLSLRKRFSVQSRQGTLNDNNSSSNHTLQSVSTNRSTGKKTRKRRKPKLTTIVKVMRKEEEVMPSEDRLCSACDGSGYSSLGTCQPLSYGGLSNPVVLAKKIKHITASGRTRWMTHCCGFGCGKLFNGLRDCERHMETCNKKRWGNRGILCSYQWHTSSETKVCNTALGPDNCYVLSCGCSFFCSRHAELMRANGCCCYCEVPNPHLIHIRLFIRKRDGYHCSTWFNFDGRHERDNYSSDDPEFMLTQYN
jgi:hypothetical protein